LAALLLGLSGGCENGSSERQTLARVGELELDARVVEEIAARDGLTTEQARARALDTLRLVAAARAEQSDRGEEPGLVPRRAEHLRRAARARLWLRERFEPSHRPEDIPDDHPLLARARLEPRLVHPEIWNVCQVVIEPPNVDDLEAKAVITIEPAWREAARAFFARVQPRILRSVAIDDHEACKLIAEQVELSAQPDDPRLSLTFPRPGGFDLDACLTRDDEGECIQPHFDPEWTAQVRAMDVPGFSEPFFTQFGLHWVYAVERLPAHLADDPATERFLRETVLDAWRAKELDRTLEELQQKRAVRMVRPPQEDR